MKMVKLGLCFDWMWTSRERFLLLKFCFSPNTAIDLKVFCCEEKERKKERRIGTMIRIIMNGATLECGRWKMEVVVVKDLFVKEGGTLFLPFLSMPSHATIYATFLSFFCFFSYISFPLSVFPSMSCRHAHKSIQSMCLMHTYYISPTPTTTSYAQPPKYIFFPYTNQTTAHHIITLKHFLILPYLFG